MDFVERVKIPKKKGYVCVTMKIITNLHIFHTTYAKDDSNSGDR